jgi:hypothetical protein
MARPPGRVVGRSQSVQAVGLMKYSVNLRENCFASSRIEGYIEGYKVMNSRGADLDRPDVSAQSVAMDA